MERISLSSNAKAVMHALQTQGIKSCPETMQQQAFNMGALELKLMGLAVIHEEEGGNVEYIRLTGRGKCYLEDNPLLRNPINWRLVMASVIALSLVVVVACLVIRILIR